MKDPTDPYTQRCRLYDSAGIDELLGSECALVFLPDKRVAEVFMYVLLVLILLLPHFHSYLCRYIQLLLTVGCHDAAMMHIILINALILSCKLRVIIPNIWK